MTAHNPVIAPIELEIHTVWHPPCTPRRLCGDCEAFRRTGCGRTHWTGPVPWDRLTGQRYDTLGAER